MPAALYIPGRLSLLSDVSLGTLLDGQALTYQASSGKWINSTPAVVSPGGSSGQLQYNASGSFGGAPFSAVAGSGNLVTLTAQADGDTPLTLKAHSATQSGNLWQAEDYQNNILAYFNNASGNSALQVQNTNGNIVSLNSGIGAGRPFANVQHYTGLGISIGATGSQFPYVVGYYSSMTTNATALFFKMPPYGNSIVPGSTNANPTDGDIALGDPSFRFGRGLLDVRAIHQQWTGGKHLNRWPIPRQPHRRHQRQPVMVPPPATQRTGVEDNQRCGIADGGLDRREPAGAGDDEP